MKPTMMCLPVMLLLCVTAFGQTAAEKEEVMKPIRTLFEGMKKGDSLMVRQAFAKDITMATVFKDKTGTPVINHESSLDGFLKAVGTPHAEVFHEMIWGEKILIDGNFAQAWTDYAFYLGKKFSHCGVDAFHLFKDKDGSWKIFHLADTRRKEGCNIPDHISNQFK